MNKKKNLNVFLLTGICVSTILNIRNWPLSAEYGLSSVAMLLIAALLFLIPISLISAELATGWPQEGGIFVWVKKAFGYKTGLCATWFVWISNVVWYPTVLSFVATSAIYVVAPEHSQNPFILFPIILLFFWGVIFINLKGISISSWVSTICLILGMILPGILIIGLSFLWVFSGHPLQLDLSFHNLIPRFSGLNEIVFFVGLLLGFAGMEMPAVHAGDVENPKKNFPKAIFLSSLIIILLSILGTFAIGAVIPQEKINLITAPLEVIAFLLNQYGLTKLTPFISALITIGALGGVSTWVMGPSRGILSALQNTNLPFIFKKVNKSGSPQTILILQGMIVSVLSLVFLFMPSINSSFWILTALATQLYLIAYLLLFASGIALRYKYPNVHRLYKVAKSNFGMIFIAGIGGINAIFSFTVGYIPPAQFDVGDQLFYWSFLTLGLFLFALPPFLIKSQKDLASTDLMAQQTL